MTLETGVRTQIAVLIYSMTNAVMFGAGSHFCSDDTRTERERWLLDIGSRDLKPYFGSAVCMVGCSAAPCPLLAAEAVGKVLNVG
jgi:hypothetical protein